jgi:mRNA interferase RelE/StbE
VSYCITIASAAVRELKKLDARTRQTVADAISALANDPRPEGVRKLSGSKDSFRIRVGDHRVLYRIIDRDLVVLVVKVAHRRDVYRKSG